MRELPEQRTVVCVRSERRAVPWRTAAAVLSAVAGTVALVVLAWFPCSARTTGTPTCRS